MAWLLDHYLLHGLLVLAFVVWFARLERKHKETRSDLRALARMFDRDLDEEREMRSIDIAAITRIHGAESAMAAERSEKTMTALSSISRDLQLLIGKR